MTKREAPVHIMRWAPGDWLSSALRGELALEKDHLTRSVYRDLLDTLHLRGGYLPRGEVGGACLVTRAEAEHAVERLLESGRIQETDDGRLYNDRILEALEEERGFRETKRESGSAGGRSTAANLSAKERSERAKLAAKGRWADAERQRSTAKHDAKHMLSTNPADAQQMQSLPPPPPLPPPTPTPQEEEKDTSSPAATDRPPDPPIDPRKATVEAAWAAFTAAAALYKPSARSWALQDRRRRYLSALLRECPDRGIEAAAQVVHGYRWARRDWDKIEKHFEPETLLNSANRTKYLEGYDEAVAAGRQPPFRVVALVQADPATARATAKSRALVEQVHRVLDTIERRQGGTS